jgi:hypothetical protein
MRFFFASLRLPLTSLLIITGLFICLFGVEQSVRAQAESAKAEATPQSTVPPTPKEVAPLRGPLTLDIVFKALRSDKASLSERNQLLIQGIRERSISFLLTGDVEKELNEQGASKALVEIIRKESEKLQESAFFYRDRGDDLSFKGNHSEAIINSTRLSSWTRPTGSPTTIAVVLLRN